MRIAIDGPSGVGKSSMAKEIASEFNLLYIDTGAMYRMIAFYFFENNLDYENQNVVYNALPKINIDFYFETKTKVIFLLNGKDVNNYIRTQEISKISSCLAKLKLVRHRLEAIQKSLVLDYSDLIMDGRDIASNIMPNADLKFYLDADINIRVKRRMLDLGLDFNNKNKFDEIYNKMLRRDKNDSEREFAPLIKVKNVIFIDTSDLDFDQVRKKMFYMIKIKLMEI